MARRNGSFNSGQYSFHSTFYCGLCNEVKPILLAEFCKQNYITPNMIHTMLRKKWLLGLKFKNRMYVNWNPELEAEAKEALFHTR
jgi:hypothetical protein